ncbi:hypothetical protein SAMN05660420_02270 [Desulfuromusa kysingii]|uniref:YD repeat-containing protein n=1 Tax=Desulfuromusa kysingii TaxID=37625 RepID=A0A1H4BLF2_9BACT|nr:hypothetical protein [Desulfuromusa kysingii]SEA49015.1 hypothetical protein SAMN05660420_02270 [Desulfuromusa kysingii]
MKYIRARDFLVILILTALTMGLSACSDSSSNHEVTALAYPYGADGISTTHSDTNDTVNESFGYNEAMQVVAYTKENTYYDDNDGDPVIDQRYVQSYTYDPSITASSIQTNLMPVAQVALTNSIFGAITSDIYSYYEIDADTGVLETTPSDQTENYYSYTASGVLLERTEVVHNGDEITSRTYTYTYNNDEKLTRNSYTLINPASAGTTFSGITTNEYDSHGNLILSTYTREGDSDGDGTDEAAEEHITSYENSYTGDLLMQTIVTENVGESNEHTYQFNYTYNTQEQLTSKTESWNNYSDDDEYDTFRTNTYTYDSAGRLLTDSEEFSYDSSGNHVINYLRHLNDVWEYNEQGVMTASSEEEIYYLDPVEKIMSGHNKDSYSYQYTENGNIAMNSYSNLLDSNLDGDFEGINSGRTHEYYYNTDGYLVSLIETTVYYDDGVITNTDTSTKTLTYTDGILTQIETVRSEDGSPNYNSNTNLTLNDDGQLSLYENNVVDGDYTATETITLTYNDDQTVTLLSENDEDSQQTKIVDFTTEGMPTGTTDLIIDTFVIRYPNSPELDSYYNGVSSADSNDKSYPLTFKIPKMFSFIYTEMMDD